MDDSSRGGEKASGLTGDVLDLGREKREPNKASSRKNQAPDEELEQKQTTSQLKKETSSKKTGKKFSNEQKKKSR